jgi:hypothetical protein
MVRLHSRLGEVLGREVPIATLFSHPTIESLAKELDQLIQAAEPQPAAETEAAEDARERTALRRASLRQLQQARGNLRGRKP